MGACLIISSIVPHQRLRGGPFTWKRRFTLYPLFRNFHRFIMDGFFLLCPERPLFLLNFLFALFLFLSSTLAR